MAQCEVRGMYLKACRDGRGARVGIGEYSRFYDTEPPHQALRYRTAAEMFISSPVGGHSWRTGGAVETWHPNNGIPEDSRIPS